MSNPHQDLPQSMFPGLTRTVLARIEDAFEAYRKAGAPYVPATNEVLMARSNWDKLMCELNKAARATS